MAYITKTQSRFAGVALLVLFFIVAVTSSNNDQAPVISVETDAKNPPPTVETAQPNTTANSESSPVAQATAESPQQGVVALQDFHRSETRDGRVVWEVWGTDATFSPESNLITIRSGKLHFTNDQEEMIEITAGKAILHIEGATLKRADTSEGVTLVHNKKVTVIAPEAVYDAEKSLVTAAGPVDIQHEMILVSGYDMVAHVDTEEIYLNRQVTSTVKPRPKDKKMKNSREKNK